MKKLRKANWVCGLCLLVMLFNGIPVQASLPGSETVAMEQEEMSVAAQNFFDSVPDEDGGSSIDDQTIYKYAAELIDVGLDPEKFAQWGAKKLLAAAMGISDDDPNAAVVAKLDIIIKNQDELARKIAMIDEKVVKSDIIKNLNEFMKTEWNGDFKNYYGTLRDIDQQYEDGTITAEAAKASREATLVYSITGVSPTGAPSGSICKYDEDAYTYGSYMTENMQVLFGSGSSDLFGMYHQLMKYKYHWENQSYEDWASFQNYAIGKYLSVISVDRLSLIARIQAIDEWNTTHPTQPVDSSLLKNRLKLVDEQVVKVQKLVKDNQVVPRPDNVRYYQYPGNEKLIHTTATQQVVPIESSGQGSDSIRMWAYHGKSESRLKGIIGKMVGTKVRSLVIEPGADFWHPFVAYQNSGNLVDNQWLKQVYDDYGGKVDLYTIFFSEGEGKLTPPEGADGNWRYVVKPTRANPLEFWNGGLFRADRINTPTVDNSGGVEQTTIYYYHYMSNEPASRANAYIGIGLAEDQLEAFEPDAIITQGAEVPDVSGSNNPKTGVWGVHSGYYAILFIGLSVVITGVYRGRRTN
ncbi:hypothetical protein [Eubacterium barkeri]|uniref:Uncharacterized protein n=1 Tax=Eubacterium barkeri TaxID=1528 RepID=A0A1H3IHY2_EUBBA|nr:hypothetical protein [Eubacterium barkeri]SDY27290.1 hypothetical protein SAMN04488579_12327 [Eubacterium barkeri]